MINNKQVNLWRGDSVPPTIYHIWVKDNSKLLIFDGQEWVVFLDNKEVLDVIKELFQAIDNIQTDIEKIQNYTVNSKPIKTNPVLSGDDILNTKQGTYINKDTLSESLLKLDQLLVTQIIE